MTTEEAKAILRDHPKRRCRTSGYESLDRVLQAAFDQAACGKGVRRHANGDAVFEHQTSGQIARHHGVGYPLGQAEKKIRECTGMLARAEDAAAVQELLGAINYISLAILVIEHRHGAQLAHPVQAEDKDV